MAPPLKGTIHTHSLADGTRAFHLRVRYRGERVRVVLHEVAGCSCGCGGSWDARSARTEQGNVLAKIRVGVWQPPAPEPVELTPTGAETFAEYADWWIQAKIRGELGARPISKNTEINYRWRLPHLVPFFGPHRLDRPDRDLCQAFKARKLQEAREITEALDAGADLRDQRVLDLVPLGRHDDAASPAGRLPAGPPGGRGAAAQGRHAVKDVHGAARPALGRRFGTAEIAVVPPEGVRGHRLGLDDDAPSARNASSPADRPSTATRRRGTSSSYSSSARAPIRRRTSRRSRRAAAARSARRPAVRW